MKFRKLGKHGPEVSVIGLGAWPIGGGMGRVDEDAAIDMLRFAIDNGVTLIDTAQAYRSSEEVIGRALAGGYRERCFLATKASGGSYTQTAMREAMEQSLRALRSDYVDLYQIHG
jgi:aryl-alcohol dehydrogenase-like predicted oxidoreductase